MAIDKLGRAALWGTTNSANFPVTPNAYSTDPTDRIRLGRSWFACVDPFQAGPASLRYSTFGFVRAPPLVAIDSRQRFHVLSTGFSTDIPPPTPSAYRPECDANPRCSERHYSIIDPEIAGDQALTYATFLGEMRSPQLLLDSNDMPWVAASTRDASVPPLAEVLSEPCVTGDPCRFIDGADILVVGLDPSLSGAASLVYQARFGGSGPETDT